MRTVLIYSYVPKKTAVLGKDPNIAALYPAYKPFCTPSFWRVDLKDIRWAVDLMLSDVACCFVFTVSNGCMALSATTPLWRCTVWTVYQTMRMKGRGYLICLCVQSCPWYVQKHWICCRDDVDALGTLLELLMMLISLTKKSLMHSTKWLL